MIIYKQIKELTIEPQTMRDFKVYKRKDGKYLITAPCYYNGKVMGETRRIFDPETNELTFE